MRSFFHFVAYHATRFAAKCLFAPVTRIQVLHFEQGDRPGPFILAANHISHFDPPLIATILRRKVDWMAMAEFFPYPVLGLVLRAINCFPADRHRADRSTIRTALDRLKRKRIVGMFPEGGIRDGANSVLGSDRLYAKRSWRPWRRTPIWIGFGLPIHQVPELEKSAARHRLEQELAAAFRQLYQEMQKTFSLTPDDLPHSPKERM